VIGQLEVSQNPDYFVEPRHEFKEVNDDVNALVWLPNSHTEIIFATEEDLSLCDIRSTWTVKKFIEEGHCKHVTSIKFDPFDSNRFATLSSDHIKIFDLRNRRRPIYVLKDSIQHR
jgi:WD40 repeat protein